ncbi:hypothetical protein HMPREF9248_0229 [Fannyhessea vaginae PB189-T1-4]|uniref:Uncharacterized protein n=1 Tax=Fannyhessea vaginae PB189-T1-4 TaxID=866774 RepID=A0ABN0AZM0_9ACTN|nr:hypothetical protein HMPREF9248_0229 [Fannyhessea vaginae PB189-T1-4]
MLSRPAGCTTQLAAAYKHNARAIHACKTCTSCDVQVFLYGSYAYSCFCISRATICLLLCLTA